MTTDGKEWRPKLRNESLIEASLVVDINGRYQISGCSLITAMSRETVGRASSSSSSTMVVTG